MPCPQAPPRGHLGEAVCPTDTALVAEASFAARGWSGVVQQSRVSSVLEPTVRTPSHPSASRSVDSRVAVRLRGIADRRPSVSERDRRCRGGRGAAGQATARWRRARVVAGQTRLLRELIGRGRARRRQRARGTAHAGSGAPEPLMLDPRRPAALTICGLRTTIYCRTSPPVRAYDAISRIDRLVPAPAIITLVTYIIIAVISAST
mmetsp:Transcript_3145/g.9104  ORF Transcript_3145/g.9104 Transcript_3145/m.9104 type:complete len:206 (+) Transcript_3145:1546-2163(+)